MALRTFLECELEYAATRFSGLCEAAQYGPELEEYSARVALLEAWAMAEALLWALGESQSDEHCRAAVERVKALFRAKKEACLLAIRRAEIDRQAAAEAAVVADLRASACQCPSCKAS